MDFKLNQATDILRRSPSVLNALLLHLPDEWVTPNEGPDTWSPFDVVGHLIHGEETDWMPRARIILTEGESRPFPSFDRFAQVERSAGKSLGELLNTFAVLRRGNLEELAEWGLTPAQLEKTGVHPEFGAVTLKQLLATWAVHDLSHIAQISRVMCRQYKEAVGPWAAYLPILRRGVEGAEHASNSGMHPTRDTTAFIKLNLVGGRVMPGVRCFRLRYKICYDPRTIARNSTLAKHS